MRGVLVAFIVAVSCLLANAPTLAKSGYLYRHSSHRDASGHHHEAGLHRRSISGRGRTGITLGVAIIQEGELAITGYTASPRAAVSVEDRFNTISSRTGRFAFHLAYYPMNCVVNIKSGDSERKAVVGNCAANGAAGKAGAAGTRGPEGGPGVAGPQGPTGLRGEAGMAGPQGPAGAQGPAGSRGEPGMAGPQGAQGSAGPQGPPGPAGGTGVAGSPGAAGLRGEAGPPGQAGAPGVQIRRVRQPCSAGQICAVTCDQNEIALNAFCPKQAPATLTGDRTVSCGIGNSDAMVAYCVAH